MSSMPNHRIILWSTGLVVVGLFLSVIGLAVYELTPSEDRTWAPAIPAIATLGLTLGGVLIISRSKDSELQSFAGAMWKRVAYATGAVIVVVALIAAILIDPISALIMAAVALQGPIAARVLSDQFTR